MRHRELEAKTIRNLVKEDAVVEHTIDALNECMNIAVKFLLLKLKDKKLSDQEFYMAVSAVDQLLADDLKAVSIWKAEKSATSARPNAQSFHGRYLGLVKCPSEAGFDDVFKFYTVSCDISRRAAKFEMAYHPYGFQYHAVERLLERTPVRSDAIHLLARRLADVAPFIRAAEDDIARCGRSELHVPFGTGDGMLIGEYTDEFPLSGISFNIRQGSVFRKTYGGHELGGRTYVVRTFVGQHMLDPRQIESMRMIEEWRSAQECDDLIQKTFFAHEVGGFDKVLTRESIEACSEIINDTDFQTGIFLRKKPALFAQPGFAMPIGRF